MLPWLIRPKNGISILDEGDHIWIHEPEMATDIRIRKVSAGLFYRIIKDRWSRRLLLKMLRAAMEENEKE